MIFPTIDQIIDLNRELINLYGGFHNRLDNLKNPGSLKWVLDAIQYPLFDIQLYPIFVDKAAILSWTINEGHVFHDGNKRTSIFILLHFIRINNFVINSSNTELYEISKIIASCKQNNFTFKNYVEWLEKRVQQKKTNKVLGFYIF